MKNSNYKSLFLIILAAFVGGAIPVYAKIALTQFPVISFTFVRFFLAALILLPVLLLQKKSINFKSFKKIAPIALLGSGNVVLFAIGVRYTTASASQMLYTMAPLLVGILSYFLIKDKIGLKKIIGIIVGFLGSLLIILLPVITGNNSLNGGTVGNLIVFAAVCSFSLYSVFSKNLQKNFSSTEITFWFAATTLLAMTILLPFDLIGHSAWVGNVSGKALFGAIYVGVLGTGIFYLLHQMAIKNSTPVIASTISYLQPAFTIIWAFGLLNEKLSLGFIIGGILAFIGVGLVTMSRNKKGAV